MITDDAQGAVAVLDVGKTHSRLTLYDFDGKVVERRARANAKFACKLDVIGIERWLKATLFECAATVPISAFVPVAHGAAMAVIRGRRLIDGIDDYEASIATDTLAAYRCRRDPFTVTGSPPLPDGLNLGAQLFARGMLGERFDADTMLLPWAQYWSWRLSGIASSEITSLGCHTDLWDVVGECPSPAAVAHGWARRFAPRRLAEDVLGRITAKYAAATGVDARARVHVGLHDSNAALLAARAAVGSDEVTLVATGTWFVAMRSGLDSHSSTSKHFRPELDCLINLDTGGRTVPSARFMGGRELENLTGDDTPPVDTSSLQDAMIAALDRIIDSKAMALPNWAGTSGPFPNDVPIWTKRPDDAVGRAAASALYAALMTDVMLTLVDAGDTIALEGRFACSEVFARALATLRAPARVFTLPLEADVSFGALRLVRPAIPSPMVSSAAKPLPLKIDSYRAAWHSQIATRS
jgi:sugar (pentulose or hexulose) kinase